MINKKNRKFKGTQIVSLGIVMIVFIVIFFHPIAKAYFTNFPKIENGDIDLSQWDFSKSGIVLLNGNWDYIEGKLISEEDDSIWKNAEQIKLPTLLYGEKSKVGTYRFKIKIDKKYTKLGMRMGNIRGKTNVYIDGNLVHYELNTKDTKGIYLDKSERSYSLFFHEHNKVGKDSSDGTLTILIQIQNESEGPTGIGQSVYFGLEEDILSQNSYFYATNYGNVLISLVLVTILFFHYRIKRNRVYIYAGLLLLSLSYYFSMSGECLGQHMIHDATLLSKISMNAAFLWILFLFVLFREILKPNKLKRYLKAYFLLAVILNGVYLICDFSKIVMGNYVYVAFQLIFLFLICMESVRFAKNQCDSKMKVYVILSMIIVWINIIFRVVHSLSLFQLDGIGYFFNYMATIGFLIGMIYYYYENVHEKESLITQILKIESLKKRIVNDTSREIKPSLYSIYEICDFILTYENENLTERQKKHINEIYILSKNLGGLVEDIHDLAFLSQGTLELKVQRINLQKSIDYVVKSFIPTTSRKIIQVLIPPAIIHGDEYRIRQIFSYLLESISQEVNTERIIIKGVIKDDNICIYIDDYGKNINQAKKEYIERNLDFNTDTEEQDIMYLLCSQLIKYTNGKLELVPSFWGEGYVFMLTFPIVAIEESDTNKSRIKTYNSKVKKFSNPHKQGDKENAPGINKILLVELNSNQRYVVKEYLEAENYQVILSFGDEVQDVLGSLKEISLVVIDMLHYNAGIDLCKKIRNYYNFMDLPILLIFPEKSDQFLTEAFDCGANDLLISPFSKDLFMVRVKNLLYTKKSYEIVISQELAFLHAQIKPHFLYNTLSTIISFCYSDSYKAADLLINLSKYFRLSFDTDWTKSKITLEKELMLSELYVKLIQARMDKEIHFNIFVESGLENTEIPPLIIQPFVENALRHGVLKSLDVGIISVDIREKDGSLFIKIEDNGVGMSEELIEKILLYNYESSGIGISNIRKRLKHYKNSTFYLVSKVGMGTKISIQIPL